MFLEPPFDSPPAPVPAPEPAMEQQLGHFVRAALGGFSPNTERAMRSDLGIYAAWCTDKGLRALPASAETVAAFVDEMAETRSPATVRRYVASIAVAHKAVGCGKTLASPVVRLALKRMHRRKGRRQAQAKGLTWPLRTAPTRGWRASASSTTATARSSPWPMTPCSAGRSSRPCK